MASKFKNFLKKTAENPIRPFNFFFALFKHVILSSVGAWLVVKGFTTEALWQVAVGGLMNFLAYFISWRDIRKVAADESTRTLQLFGLLRTAISTLGGVLLAFPAIDANYVNAAVAGALSFIASLASAKAPEKTLEVEEKVWKAEVIDDMDP